MKSLLGLLLAIAVLGGGEVRAHDNYDSLLKFINSHKRFFKFPYKHNHNQFPHYMAQIQVSKKGLKIPIMEAKEGDVLAFDGERWVPSDLSDMLGEGVVGPMGPAGLQGLKGDKGDKGDTGAMGPQGIAGIGVQGAAGVAGAKGDKGDKGDAGAQGVAGVAGANGDKGDKGDKGDAGAQGVAGVAGAKGDKGDKGDAGAMGPQGIMGLMGLDGLAGTKGDKGDKGDAGAMGPQGIMGLMGLDGLAGTKGDKGDKGDAGAMGPQGIMGLMGLDGLAGAKGDKGDKGDAGAMGPMGLQGLSGLQGEKGDKGDRGDKGDAGRDANLYAGTNPGDMVQLDQDGRIPASVMPAVAASNNVSEVAYIRDVKPSGVHGGSCFANTWVKRDLNFHSGSTSFISLANSQITLAPGEYRIEGRAPAFQIASHKAKMVLVSNGATVLVGSSARSHATYASATDSFFNDTLIVNVTSTFEIHHICAKDYLDYGLGAAGAFGEPEVYTQLKIEKVK